MRRVVLKWSFDRPAASSPILVAAYLRDEQLQKVVVSDTPLGRVGQPEDVAGAIASLLSADTRWITGQRVEVNGGYRL